LDPALVADDDCQGGSEECGVELRQLRGEVNSARSIIARQLEENKKYQVALDDESGSVCKAPKGWKTTGMSCGPGTKCCTSQPSYLAGTAHASQSHLSLYSICCSVNDHCKFDTIFVSCGGGPGPDDYSGVIAGLQEDGQTSEQAQEEVNVQQGAAEAAEALPDDDEDQYEAVDEAEDEAAEPMAEEADAEEADAEEADAEEADAEEAYAGGALVDDAVEVLAEQDAEVTGGKCTNKKDMKIWKSGGKQQYDAAMDHCGTSCAAGFPCTKSCMQKHGYSSGCAGCMAHAVECGRDHCLSQCISNHMSKACVHCNKKTCRPVMKRCSGWNVGGH